MENFWDFSVWGDLHLIAMLLLSLLVANALKKAIPDGKLRRRTALILAISTTPWAFMCPFF